MEHTHNAIDQAVTYLNQAGVELPDNLLLGIAAIKAGKRDKREPARREKMQAEERLAAVLQRAFRKQARKLRAYLEDTHPNRKALSPTDLDFDDEELEDLIEELLRATRGGISLFASIAGADIIDYTLTNAEALNVVRNYVTVWQSTLGNATRKALQSALEAFIQTPGMTIRDVMDAIISSVFSEDRALRVAVTEITRAYANGQQMAGDALKQEYPDVKVMKRWFTNEDEVVCTEFCVPLAGKEIPVEETFYEYEDVYANGNPPRHVNCRCWIETYTALAEL